MSAPTDLPSGDDVQERIAVRADELLGVSVQEPENDRPTLEELGDAAAAMGADVLAELRSVAVDTIDFKHVAPNFGHFAIALLLREGLVETMTVNWDCGVENAARNLDFEVARILRQEDRGNRPVGAVLDKLNGCASQPTTLRITREEVDAPQAWAAHRVGAVLTDSTVAFIGLGTVGAYVAEGVERILEGLGERVAPIIIVNTSLSEGWKAALGDSADAALAGKRADPFLDELLRAVLALALTNATDAARRWSDGGHPDAGKLIAGADTLFSALGEHSAVPVWRWWRDGADGSLDGKQFILDRLGETALATVCGLIGDGGVVISGREDALVVEADDCYLEICCFPGRSGTSVVTRQAERIRKRRRRNVYANAEKTVMNVAVGHHSPLPVRGVEIDITDAGGSPNDVVDGADRVTLEWLAGDAYSQKTP